MGEYNVFGDEKTDADVEAEKIILKHLQKADVVRGAISKD
jgi:fructose-1,6-bisphosphatase